MLGSACTGDRGILSDAGSYISKTQGVSSMVTEQSLRTYRFENADDAAAAVPRSQLRYLPLRRPISEWRMTDITLAGSHLVSGTMGASISIFGRLDPDIVYFCIALSGVGWKTYGKEIGIRGLTVLSRATEYAAWLDPSVHYAVLQVPIEKVAQRYERFAASVMSARPTVRMFSLSAPISIGIRSAIGTTLRIARGRPQVLSQPRMGRMLEDLILDHLVQAAGADSQTVRPEYPKRAGRCNEYLEANANRPVTLADLRDVLQVGDRALRRFFVSAYGTSPAHFLRTQRLLGANRILADARSTESVTTAAMSFGFFDLGRFARQYRVRFGEKPSETLQRSRGRSAVAAMGH
jgi:AraC-like DNA-binding protein